MNSTPIVLSWGIFIIVVVTIYMKSSALLKLALVFHVSISTVERCFSKIKHIKIDLRNRMSDDYFNDALTCAIKKEELINVKNDGARKRISFFFLFFGRS